MRKRKVKSRPPRLYEDKKGRIYILIKGKKIQIKTSSKSDDYTKRELLDIILKTKRVKRRKRATTTTTTTTKKPTDITNRYQELEFLNKLQKINQPDINLLNRELLTKSDVKELITPPRQAILPPPSPKKSKKMVEEKLDNEKMIEILREKTIKDGRKKRNTNILKDLLNNRRINFKGNSKTEDLFDLLRLSVNNEKIFLEELQNSNMDFGGVREEKDFSMPKKTAIEDLPPPLEVEPPLIEKKSKKKKKKNIPEQRPIKNTLTEEEFRELIRNLIIVGEQEYDLLNEDQKEFLEEIKKTNNSMNRTDNDQEASGKTDGGLYSDQIIRFMKPFSKFIGVYASDQIKKIDPMSKKQFGFIMNTDPISKSGKHWVAVYIDIKNDMSLEYYDSFGEDPPVDFQKNIKFLIDKIKTNVYLKFKINKIIQQRSNTDTCGYFTMRFLINRFAGKDWKFCSGYRDIDEKAIEKFKKNLKFNYI